MPSPELLSTFTFGPQTRVVYFGARPGEEARSLRYLAWPVLAYRIAVPEQEVKINPLQRAVLRLLSANPDLRVEAVADLLRLHQTLVALILGELMELEYVRSADQRLTLSGLSVLKEEAPQLRTGARIETGFVFQDPFTGDVHPQFVSSLQYADLQEDAAWPGLHLGKQRGVIPLFYEVGEISPPDRISSRAIGAAYSGTREPSTLLERGRRNQAGQARLLDVHPRPLMLITCAYFPGDDVDADWVVANPFGPREDSPFSPVIHRAMQRREESSAPLQKFMARLYGEERQQESGTARVFLQHVRAEAERRINSLLERLPQHDLLHRHILRCEQALIEAESLHESHPEKLEHVMLQVRKVAESIVLAVRDQYPIDLQVGQIQPKDQRLLNETAAKQLGFGPLPRALANIRPQQLKFVNLNPGADQFRVLLMACVHMATRNAQHPLALAVRHEPQLLTYLDTLFSIGSEPAHAQSQKTYTLPAVQQAVSAAYQTATTIFARSS